VVVIEVILAPTEHELSEVRCDGAAINWFRDRTTALAFADHFALALQRRLGTRPFVSVCQTDGTWVAMHDLPTLT
jgi:hypothetical protein